MLEVERHLPCHLANEPVGLHRTCIFQNVGRLLATSAYRYVMDESRHTYVRVMSHVRRLRVLEHIGQLVAPSAYG